MGKAVALDRSAPWGRAAFKLVPLALHHRQLVLAAALIPVSIIEVTKLVAKLPSVLRPSRQ